jgi:general secretion pathway protein A
MYIEHFGLTTKPFQITSDPTFLWLGEKHKEALATLRYGVQDNRGFLLLTGEVGTGKTILVNKLISLLDSNTIVATLPDPDLDGMDFYKLLADGLKMSQPFHDKAEFLIQFRQFLHQCHSRDKKVLLIIDESQRLKHQLMEEIRILSNIELQDRKLINIFFVGQPEFNIMLMTPENRALSQRITVRYNIEVLDQQETCDYVTHRLRVAGSKKPLFKITALHEIFLFSGGIPRLINIICDHALLTAFGKNLQQVDVHIVRECAEELRIPVEAVRSDVATLRTKEEAHPDTGAMRPQQPAGPGPGKWEISDTLRKGLNAIRVRAMPIKWELFCYGGILLVLLALLISITHHSGVSEGQNGGPDETAKETMAAGENQEGRRPGSLSTVQPVPGGHPAGGGPAEDIAAVDKAGAQITSETSVPESESRIGPLPLLEEKVIIRFNSNEIDSGAYTVLNRIARYLATNPQQRVVIEGYTDSSGSPGLDETVSDFRARAVKSYLIAKGVNADHMTIHAMGSSDPVTSDEVVSGGMENRRVEIRFVKNK